MEILPNVDETPVETILYDSKITAVSYKMEGSNNEKGELINQDSFKITVLENNTKIIIICDGHGRYGKYYSDTVINRLTINIVQNIGDILNNSSCLSEIFLSVNRTLLDFKSGTTCTVIIITSNKIICANVGDCEVKIKLSSINDVSLFVDGKSKDISSNIIDLTVDHGFSNREEALRVLKLGYNIEYDSVGYKKFPVYNLINNELNLIEYPIDILSSIYKFNAKNDLAIYGKLNNIFDAKGINMSRSMGDFDYGFIIANPSITELNLPDNMSLTILCGSDGFFNAFTDKEIDNLYDKNGLDIIKDVYNNVDKVFNVDKADNTTIIVYKNMRHHNLGE